MPLVLTLKKGDDFFVGDRRFLLTSITRDDVVLDVSGYGEVTVGANWDDAVEGIHLAVNKIGSRELSTAKLAIDAPGHKILRGKLYREL